MLVPVTQHRFRNTYCRQEMILAKNVSCVLYYGRSDRGSYLDNFKKKLQKKKIHNHILCAFLNGIQYCKVEFKIKEETAKKLFLNTNPFWNLETNYQKAFNFYLI